MFEPSTTGFLYLRKVFTNISLLKYNVRRGDWLFDKDKPLIFLLYVRLLTKTNPLLTKYTGVCRTTDVKIEPHTQTPFYNPFSYRIHDVSVGPED